MGELELLAFISTYSLWSHDYKVQPGAGHYWHILLMRGIVLVISEFVTCYLCIMSPRLRKIKHCPWVSHCASSLLPGCSGPYGPVVSLHSSIAGQGVGTSEPQLHTSNFQDVSEAPTLSVRQTKSSFQLMNHTACVLVLNGPPHCELRAGVHSQWGLRSVYTIVNNIHSQPAPIDVHIQSLPPPVH